MAAKLSDAQIELINKIGYTNIAETTLTLTEAETLETLKKSRLVRVRAISKYFNPDQIVFYELSKRGFALYEEMLHAFTPEDTPAPDSTLADELPAYRDHAGVERVLFLSGCSGPASNGNLTGREDLTCGNCGKQWVSADFFEEGDHQMCECGMTLSKSDLLEGFAYAVDEYAAPTGPTLPPAMVEALKNHDVNLCYLTTDPIATCECPVCAKPRLERENAALKARVNELEHERNFIGAMFERARDVTYSSLTGEAFNRDWLNRLEQLYMQVAKFHPLPMTDAEIKARAADWSETKLDGRPDASGSTRHIDGVPY